MSEVLLQAQQLSTGYMLCNSNSKHPSKSSTKIVGKYDSLSLSQGEFVCLLGGNGSGKSTLLRSLSGLQQALSGDILLEGKSLHSWSLKERAQRIALVLTERNLPAPFKAQELVALGRHPHSVSWKTSWKSAWGALSHEDHKAIEWALKSTGMWELRNQDLQELSDGEVQKIMIARGLAQQAPILILDEPAIFLDLPYRMELFELLRHLAEEEGMGILCSCHDLELAFQYAHTFWMLSAQGECLTGTPDECVQQEKMKFLFDSDTLQFDSKQRRFYRVISRKTH